MLHASLSTSRSVPTFPRLNSLQLIEGKRPRQAFAAGLAKEPAIPRIMRVGVHPGDDAISKGEPSGEFGCCRTVIEHHIKADFSPSRRYTKNRAAIRKKVP